MSASTTFSFAPKSLLPSHRRRVAVDGFDIALSALLALAVLCLVLPETLADLLRVPSWAVLPVVPAINILIDWVRFAFEPALRVVASGFDWQIRVLDRALLSVPWPVFLAIAAVAVFRLAGWRLALLTVATGFYVVIVGYWQETLHTLALVTFALPIALCVGALAGAAAYLDRRVAIVVDVVLDMMQTIPAFAFLVPMIVLFGFGPVPGVIASALYAAPTMARNVRLGLEMAPREVIEAGQMAGCTPAQLFFLVRVPLARRQCLLGLNQAIMATLSMVIFAAAIGGFEDIGWEVLRTARRAEFGNGILAGLIITLLAMLLDRVTAAAVERTPESSARRPGLPALLVAVPVIAALWSLSLSDLMPVATPSWRAPIAAWMDRMVLDLSVVAAPLTETVKSVTTSILLLPLRAGLGRSVFPGLSAMLPMPLVVTAYAATVILLAGATRRAGLGNGGAISFIGLLLYTGFTGFPWLPMVAIATAFAWRFGGYRLAMKTALALLAIALSGFWPSAMFSLYLCSAAVIACIVLGGAAGIAAGEWAAVSRLMRPVNDFLQTIPPFVILIPVIMFFKIGDFSSFLAIVAYAIAAMARYTEEGLRNVPQTQIETGLLSGCSRLQLLRLVKLPAAAPQILLGLRQTTMYALAMLSVAALVGSRGLGQDVYVALGKADAGLGLMAGASIALIALVADGFIRAALPARGQR